MIFNLELVIMSRPMDFHDPDPDPGPPIFGRGPGSTSEDPFWSPTLLALVVLTLSADLIAIGLFLAKWAGIL